MRLIVIGTLVVIALAIALLYEVSTHTEPASASVVQTTAHTPAPAVTAVPPVVVEQSAIQPNRAMPTARAAPMLVAASPTPPTTDAAKPKHIDTPIDILRWSLMRAIRNSEPAVIDCLDKAKLAGTVVDGAAMFAFHVTAKDAKVSISQPSVEKSPFPDPVNDCIQAALATGELDQELPEGQKEYRVLRELVVDKGVITRYKLQSFLPI